MIKGTWVCLSVQILCNSLLTNADSTPKDSTTSQTSNNETGSQEPLAGAKGDVRAGEPYDKGNTGVVSL